MNRKFSDKVIAVLLPCYNEERSIGKTIERFRMSLPEAKIYVYDNNSTDKTVDVAIKHGAIVKRETSQGKGFVVRRMFADIDADIYIMADGDHTYDASIAPVLINTLLSEDIDMVVGARTQPKDAYRPGHIIGNILFSRLISGFFCSNIKDVFSGYRVMTRRFVKTIPVFSRGFEIETELTVHALQLGIPVKEVATQYSSRMKGSQSKLSTYKDGLRILNFILFLIRDERPLLFFSCFFFLFSLLSLILGFPLLFEYFETGLVPRFPTAILASGLGVIGVISLFSGFILDSVSRGRRESKKLRYLAYKFNNVNYEYVEQRNEYDVA